MNNVFLIDRAVLGDKRKAPTIHHEHIHCIGCVSFDETNREMACMNHLCYFDGSIPESPFCYESGVILTLPIHSTSGRTGMKVKRTSCTPDQTPLALLFEDCGCPEEAVIVASRRFSMTPAEALGLVWTLRRIAKAEQPSAVSIAKTAVKIGRSSGDQPSTPNPTPREVRR